MNGIRTRRRLALLVLAWMASGAIAAEPAVAPQNVVHLSAQAVVEVPHDWLSVSLSTLREGTDAAGVQTQLKQALDKALVDARDAVVAGQLEVRTGAFSIQPRFNREGKSVGWAGTAELIVEGRDAARIAALAGRLSSLSVASVQWGLSRATRQQAEVRAQAEAIERFRARALEIARGFGFAAYGLREVNVQTGEGGGLPRLRAAAAPVALADSALPVESGKGQVTVTVSGSVQLR